MMLTEEQAREKWCPFVRSIGVIQDGQIVTGNRAGPSLENIDVRSSDNPQSCRCIASDCMMWRFDAASVQRGEYQGYCGLAGKPEAAE